MEGNGKRAYELLTGSKDFKSRGNFRKGYTLWESDQDWGLTLAGVAEAVVAEADLNSEQAARLRDALTSVIDFKSTKVVLPLVFTYSTSGSPAAGSQIGIEIESAEEFLEVLLEERSSGVITQSLVQYVRERFTASDVPKLLAALDSTPYPSDKRGSAQRLFNVAPFLLVHWGEGLPQVEAELERLLLHPAGFVRMTTVCAFGYGGARPFYSREEWMPSEAVDAFAVRKLLPICKGEGQGYQSRGEAWCVLAEIVHRRPEYAEQVVPVLIDVLGDASVLSNYKFGDYFLKLGEVAPEVVVAGVPKLRALLESLDVQYFSDPEAESAAPNWEHRGHCKVVLASLSAAASQSPELSEEVAIQYLERMGQGQLMGPFAPLLSPDRPAITKRVIEALLDSPDVAKDELEPVVKTIRDWKEA